jgi:glycerate-2-kinase
MYFANVTNILIVSNLTALEAMQKKAQELGVTATIYSEKFQGNAKEAGKQLIDAAKSGEILLVGGETTVKVTGTGQGGRNQELVLAALASLDDKTILASFDSDGWDFFEYAGAIGDHLTMQKAKELGLDLQAFLDNDDSYGFFTKVDDGILTGKLESNVSDLMIVYKKASDI